MAMTPKNWADLGLTRKYERSDPVMDRLMSSIKAFLKWIESTHGEVSDCVVTYDGEKWIATIYVAQVDQL